MISPTTAQKRSFRRRLYYFFNKHGRDLPWRNTEDPYHILISEIMLQQTQVDRVISKYKLFIKRFPTIQHLAKAPLPKLLAVWQSLGYNRRALMLHSCAQIITKEYNGVVPNSPEILKSLPGIGKATAASIRAFAFNKPIPFIETNVRTVFIHEFFNDQSGVTDDQLMPLIEETMDKKNPCKWYSALMDYGTKLKKEFPNPSRKSAHHNKQSRFEGSNRQIRGKVLKLLLENKALSLSQINKHIVSDSNRLQEIVNNLVKEGFITHKNDKFGINSSTF